MESLILHPKSLQMALPLTQLFCLWECIQGNEVVLTSNGYKDVLSNIVHYKNWKQHKMGLGKSIIEIYIKAILCSH